MGGEWSAYGITHTGNIRSHNEDAYLNLPQKHLWLVADGMGGHSAGDVASHMVVEDLERCYSSTPLLGRNIQHIRRRFHVVNDRLIKLASDDAGKVIGCTVAALIIHRSHCVCLWAGDSRIYRYRNGSLKQITRDHSELDELVDQGIPLEEAQRSPYAQSITRAVGASTMLAVEAQITEHQYDDVYLLCSDGLNKELSDQDISDILSSHTPDDGVRAMLQTALQRNGQDNITIMTVYMEQQ